jgi:hypothetical protein
VQLELLRKHQKAPSPSRHGQGGSISLAIIKLRKKLYILYLACYLDATRIMYVTATNCAAAELPQKCPSAMPLNTGRAPKSPQRSFIFWLSLLRKTKFSETCLLGGC